VNGSRPAAMRIAVTADPELPVPPRLYGGIERIIHLLVRGLVSRGHDVTLFAHPDSSTTARLVRYPGRDSRSWQDTVCNAALITAEALRGGFDVIHSFSRIAYLLPLLPLRVPKLMTYQRPVTRRSVKMANRLAHGTLQFSAISRQLMEGVRHLGVWHLVYNGVDANSFDFTKEVRPDAPLVFLGRIEHLKGTHLAIDVARRTRSALVIAGNVAPEHQAYFDQQVRPHLDGGLVTFIGPVDDRAKNDLLGRARALLMPVLWEEPFGIVMVEAMACGTPVLGFARGAIPEVIEDGVTGYVRRDLESLVKAVGELPRIDRASCRARVERLFSGDAIVGEYLRIYEGLRYIGRSKRQVPSAPGQTARKR